ncbi:T9SS type A sorting domain-containing protein [Taibaiella soli]|uniref:Secretion system C-terminal sorting domain-containing protein n=1 Tax=Taibaiella soli TaxID=1649169 RepID=A0A2W2B7F9_9BACT|nr:T9SS type A sorting domain-containing protein [Taibaiella soli]PZF71957.1 hypothetical protein DN068_15725 [Taibaiella soli]
MNKKLYQLFLLPIASLSISSAGAQGTYNTTANLDINNIKAAALVHGDLWWNPATQNPACEFPKGSGKNIGQATGIWMGGYDHQGNLHIAAQTYRQNGNDYWPGPLDANGQTTSATVQNWARIWKIDQTTIDSFRAMTSHTTTNTPTTILEWPAKGNPYAKGNNGATLTISDEMAPFVDVDSNGDYNPINGDYPAIKGDQMLWFVYNDVAGTHGTNTDPIGIETQVSAYGYSRGTAIDNILYYDFKLLNKSQVDYDSFRMAMWSDMDLGFAFDDYIGYDSVHRMGIVYNADSSDTQYGRQLPIAGVSMINLPGDAWGVAKPAGSFMTFDNSATANGNPTSAVEYYNLMHSRNRVGTQISNPLTSQPATYIYPDDPSLAGGWSECAMANTPGDRRFVIATNDFVLEHSSSQLVTMALVVQPMDTSNYCGSANFTKIKDLADTAWNIYNNPLAPLPPIPNAVVNIAKRNLNIYPNPATETLFITGDNVVATGASIMIYDAVGRNIPAIMTKKNNKIEVDIHSLPNGIYTILYRNGDQMASNIFVKK